MLVSFGLVALINSVIVPSIGSFKNSYNSMEESRIACLKMGEETGLVEFNEKEGDAKYDASNAKDITITFERYLKQHILLAYQTSPSSFDGMDLAPMKAYTEKVACFENDPFGIFYTIYAPKYNSYGGKTNDVVSMKVEGYSGELTPKAYHHYIVKYYTPVDTTHLELYPWGNAGGLGDEDYLTLTGEYAKNLYTYISFGKKSENVAYYNELQVMYQNLYNASTKLFTASSRYNDSLNVYYDSYRSCALTNVAGIVIGYLFAFLLANGLPVLITKNGTTLGELAMRMRVITKDEEIPTIKNKLLRLLITVFTGFGVLIPATYFAGSLTGCCMYPMFSIGSLNVSLFGIMVTLFIISIISLLVMGFDRKKRSFVELASLSQVVDIREYDPELVVEDDTNVETDSAKEVIEDGDYFDSTCFDNQERTEAILESEKRMEEKTSQENSSVINQEDDKQ